MYYTHGDTVVYRSDRPEKSDRKERPRRSRDLGGEPEQEPRRFECQPAVEQVLAERVQQLEERLARLEAELEEARQYSARQAPRQGGVIPVQAPGQRGQVKVSLHAEGGAQATVGQVRMVSQD